MRCIRLAFLLLAATATAAFPQDHVICLYSDIQGSECNFDDTEAGVLKQYFVFHTDANGSASEFAAPLTACMNGVTWLGDEAVFPVTLGTSQAGVSIGYGSCQSSPVHILTINMYQNGLTAPNCPYPVIPHPDSGELRATDCNYTDQVAFGGTVYINSTIPCECSASAFPPELDVSPTFWDYGVALESWDFSIANVGAGTLVWSASTQDPWLSMSPDNGVNGGTMTITVDRSLAAPGLNNGTVTVSSNGGTIDIMIQATVEADPELSVDPLMVDFPGNVDVNFFNITNTGGGILNWDIVENIDWLDPDVTSGVNDRLVFLTVDRTGLTPGQYQGNVDVTSNGGNETVAITMTVPEPVPVLGYSPPSLSFPYGVDQLPLNIFNSGEGTLDWTIAPDVAWLGVDQGAGSGDATINVTVDRTGLADGNYGGNLLITSNGGNANVPVMLTVLTQPVLSVNPTLLLFTQTTTLKFFQITNLGAPTLEWSTSADEPWIQIQPPQSGSGDAEVWVQIDLGQLPPGQQTGHVDVTSNGGDAQVTIRYNPPAPTFPGHLRLTADPAGSQCEVYDLVGQLLSVYVVHTNTPGVYGSSFAAPMPSCMVGAVYLTDNPFHPIWVGDSQSGMQVNYDACLPGPITVVEIIYFVQGLSQQCCQYNIVGNPQTASGQIEALDCAQQIQLISSSPGIVNPQDWCYCGLLPVEETTWGAVKSLYAPRGE
jgi:hypothetical protein